LLNERGEAVARSKLYKIKAKDIEGAHYEKFDLGVQKMVLLGLQKCYQAGKPITPANLRYNIIALLPSFFRSSFFLSSFFPPC
jgi:hypothetical protein